MVNGKCSGVEVRLASVWCVGRGGSSLFKRYWITAHVYDVAKRCRVARDAAVVRSDFDQLPLVAVKLPLDDVNLFVFGERGFEHGFARCFI